MSEQIICKNTSLGYDGNIVTADLNFTVCKGDYLCILGENGSGKSTLIKAILGLRPQISGDIKQKEIGYLPQQTAVQKDYPASVREIVRSGCLSKSGLRPYYSKKEIILAENTMKRIGIDHLSKRCYRELSGGQQQRVLLARALCAADKLILLDEPVTGLDPKAQMDFYELTSGLNHEGITVIMVSHDISSAVKYASHILHIGSGKQLFFGKTEEYLQSRTGKSLIESED